MQRMAFILGGLPVIAEVNFGYDSGSPYSPAEAWAEVEAIYWMKRDGTAGKPIPDHLWERAEKYDPYFGSVIEDVQNALIYEADEAADDRRMVKFDA